jgi:hypothetical protein
METVIGGGMFQHRVTVPSAAGADLDRWARSAGRYRGAEPQTLAEVAQWIDTVAPGVDPRRCPGIDDPRCCGAHSPASAFAALGCLGGGWRELEDIEWFVGEALHAAHMVSKAIEVAAPLETVAALGVALGRRCEALALKVSAEPAWQWGQDKREASRDGGKANARAPHEARAAAVEEKLASTRLSGNAASRAVAASRPDLGSWRAIYDSWKKRARS